MSRVAAPEIPAARKRGQEAEESPDPLADVVAENVLRKYGRPRNIVKIRSVNVFNRNYRVNVFAGDPVRIALSVFVTVDETGNLMGS